jgi:hypothetical protein
MRLFPFGERLASISFLFFLDVWLPCHSDDLPCLGFLAPRAPPWIRPDLPDRFQVGSGIHVSSDE